MAWELQGQMAKLIEPSILKEIHSFSDPNERLIYLFVEQNSTTESDEETFEKLRETALDMGSNLVLEFLVQGCIQIGLTTNGGHAFYIDEDLYTSVNFIEDEEYELYLERGEDVFKQD